MRQSTTSSTHVSRHMYECSTLSKRHYHMLNLQTWPKSPVSDRSKSAVSLLLSGGGSFEIVVFNSQSF